MPAYPDTIIQTALELAKAYLSQEVEEVFIATGLNYPDALAGGVLEAKRGSRVLLVRVLLDRRQEIKFFREE